MASHFLQQDDSALQTALKDTKRDMQEESAQAQGKLLGLPYINLNHFPVDLQVLGYFTEDEAKSSQSLPFFREGKDLRVGTVNPSNGALIAKMQALQGEFNVKLYAISQASLEQFLGFYKKVVT